MYINDEIESGSESDSNYDLNASKYKDDISIKLAKEKAPGTAKFLHAAAEENLAFPVDSRITDDPNV